MTDCDIFTSELQGPGACRGARFILDPIKWLPLSFFNLLWTQNLTNAFPDSCRVCFYPKHTLQPLLPSHREWGEVTLQKASNNRCVHAVSDWFHLYRTSTTCIHATQFFCSSLHISLFWQLLFEQIVFFAVLFYQWCKACASKHELSIAFGALLPVSVWKLNKGTVQFSFPFQTII